MVDSADLRRGTDRRSRPRGGRRESDVDGFTPLVFVIAGEQPARETCEAILAKLRFAVAPFSSSEAALSVIDNLRPDLIVAAELDHRHLLGAMRDSQRVPIVPLSDSAPAEAIVEAVRRALRLRNI